MASIIVTFFPYHPLIEAEAGSNAGPVSIKFVATAAEESVLGTQTSSNVSSEIEQKEASLEKFYSDISVKVAKNKEYKERLQRNIAKLVSFLKKQGSPIANSKYAEQIILLSEKSGVDYRIIIGIMGVESGFCAANYMRYNCFGYLNKVQYSSFENAFNNLIPKISRQYIKVYGTNFSALEKAYGVHNVEAATKKMQTYYAMLK
jgi:hypothetical protein